MSTSDTPIRSVYSGYVRPGLSKQTIEYGYRIESVVEQVAEVVEIAWSFIYVCGEETSGRVAQSFM